LYGCLAGGFVGFIQLGKHYVLAYIHCAQELYRRRAVERNRIGQPGNQHKRIRVTNDRYQRTIQNGIGA
jgi:hypothetical protein